MTCDLPGVGYWDKYFRLENSNKGLELQKNWMMSQVKLEDEEQQSSSSEGACDKNSCMEVRKDTCTLLILEDVVEGLEQSHESQTYKHSACHGL